MKRMGMIVLVAWLVVMMACSKEDQRQADELPEAKAKLVKLVVDRYAKDYFPRWAMANTSMACPSSLADLAKLGGQTEADTIDPWGTPYRMKCGADMPEGVRGGIAVSSAGPDKQHDTADDIRSW